VGPARAQAVSALRCHSEPVKPTAVKARWKRTATESAGKRCESNRCSWGETWGKKLRRPPPMRPFSDRRLGGDVPRVARGQGATRTVSYAAHCRA
jgi:hypothetical protein